MKCLRGVGRRDRPPVERRSIPKLRPTPHGKPRPRKRRACAHFGWPRKQPTRILQIATRRQRRPVDLSRGSAFQDLWLQVRQNPGKGTRTGAGRGPSTPLLRSAGTSPWARTIRRTGIGVGPQDAGPTREMSTRVLPRSRGIVRITGRLGREVAGSLCRWLSFHTAATLTSHILLDRSAFSLSRCPKIRSRRTPTMAASRAI